MYGDSMELNISSILYKKRTVSVVQISIRYVKKTYSNSIPRSTTGGSLNIIEWKMASSTIQLSEPSSIVIFSKHFDPVSPLKKGKWK